MENIIVLLLLMASFICIIISITKIIKLNIENNKTKDISNELEEITKIKEISYNDNIEVISQTEKIPKENPYWDYIKMNLINVDFKLINC